MPDKKNSADRPRGLPTLGMPSPGGTWLAFMVLTTLAILWGVYSVTAYRTLADEIKAETLAADKAHVEMGAQFVYLHQQGFLNKIKAVAEDQPFVIALNYNNKESLTDQIAILENESDLDIVLVIDRSGAEMVRRSKPHAPDNLNPDWRRMLEEVNRTQKPYVSEVTVLNQPLSRSLIFVAIPVMDQENQLAGLLVAIQNLSVYTDFYSRLSARPGRLFYLLDSGGQVIAGDKDAAHRWGRFHTAQRLAVAANQPGQAAGSVVYDPIDGQPMFLSVSLVPGLSWFFVVTHDYTTVMTPVHIMFQDITIFLLLLFVCLFAVASLLAARYELQKKTLNRVDEEARRLEMEVQARTADLNLSTARIRDLSHQLIRAQEEERQRLALDLHDEMGQVVSAVKIGLQNLAQRQEMDVGLESVEIRKLINLTQKVMDRVRALAHNLRPAILDNFGLTAAIEDLCESTASAGNIVIERRLTHLNENQLSPEIKTTLFRFVQEGLTNAVRYSGSSKFEVGLSSEDHKVRVWVKDQGVGFDVEQTLAHSLAEKKLGLIGMMERLDLVGGRLTIHSGPEGTILLSEVDLEDHDAP